MDHRDHVNLLRPAGIGPGGRWADLGAGEGAFTLALRELAGPTAEIHAVDRDRRSLERLRREYAKRFEVDGKLSTHTADFRGDLPLPPVDGLLMANSLHFHHEHLSVLEHVRTFLKPGGVLLLVEYNAARGNRWVPYPLTFEKFAQVTLQAGYQEPHLLARAPSSFLREFYSAAAYRPAQTSSD